VTDVGNFVVFKPVLGGYVYRAPNTWLIGPSDHYLVNEAQQSEILTVIRSSSRPVLWVTGLTWLALSLLAGSASVLWAHRSGYNDWGLRGVLLIIVAMFSLYPALLISRQLLLFRLRPILTTLPCTNERITNLEARQAIGKAALTLTVSPTRRRVVRIACVVVWFATLGEAVSRTIDMYEINQSLSLALYDVTVSFSGALNVMAIVGFAFVFVTFGRDRSRA
jgi:hypothetical protein